MPLTNIEYGSLASSEVMNDNFEYLDDRVTTVANNLTSTASTINSNIASMNSTFTLQNENIMSDIEDLNTDLSSLIADFNAYDITPDYTHAVTVKNSSGSGSHNINWNGWVAFDLYCNQNSANYQISVDGVRVGATASDEKDRACGIVMVKTGSVISWNGSQSIIIKKVLFKGG